MSTDRELLELAAKAAGYKRLYEMPIARDRSFYMIEEAEGDRFTPWNPLKDDGASLRLAADVPDLNIGWVFEEAWRQFPLAVGQQLQRREYIRHRIVGCAAGHGRAMP